MYLRPLVRLVRKTENIRIQKRTEADVKLEQLIQIPRKQVRANVIILVARDVPYHVLYGANLIIEECIVNRRSIKIFVNAVRFEYFILKKNRELLLKVLCIFV